MYIIFLAAILILTSFGVYQFIKYGQSRVGTTVITTDDELADKLDSLFYKEPKKIARLLRISCPVLLCLIGFWLPGSFSGLDKILLDNAVKLNKQGLHEQAYELLIRMPQANSPLLHNEKGVAQLNLGDDRQAVRSFRQAIALLPEYSQAHANLAEAYILNGQYTDAEFEYKRARDFVQLKIDPKQIYGKSHNDIKSFFLKLLFAIVFLVIGLKLPKLIVGYLYIKRLKKFENDLPDALSILSNSLKAGLSLTQSIELLVEQTGAPVSEEFGLVLNEYKLGKSIDEALNGLYKRLPTEDNQILVNTTSLLFETGGDIPEAVESVALTIRERKRLRLKIESMTAEGKAQAVILLLIPIVLAVVLNAMQKEAFNYLYTTVAGWMAILVMLLLALIGAWSMWKVLQVKI